MVFSVTVWTENLDVPGTLSAKAGGSSALVKVGGILSASFAQVGNVGTGEDNLFSYAIPASLLSADGDSLWFEALGTFAATINAKRLRVRFGSASNNLILDSGALAIVAAGSWRLAGRIIRTGAATQKGLADLLTSITATLQALPAVVTNLNQTLSGSIDFKITGEATANSDVVIESCVLGWEPVNT